MDALAREVSSPELLKIVLLKIVELIDRQNGVLNAQNHLIERLHTRLARLEDIHEEKVEQAHAALAAWAETGSWTTGEKGESSPENHPALPPPTTSSEHIVYGYEEQAAKLQADVERLEHERDELREALEGATSG
jgi:hypothetical protein